MKIKTSSKLNLFLKVISKRDDGYHDIKTIMSEFDFGDEIVISKSASDSFTSNMVSTGPNLVEKALLKLREHVHVPSVSIELKKMTPIGSGMGTGSSDASETLKGLNDFFNLKLERKTLLNIASEIGMDVPFFIDGKLALATNRGDELKAIDGVFKKALVVMDEPVISKNIYTLLEPSDFDSDEPNTLILPVLRNYPKVRDFYSHLQDIDKNFRMSGAGGAFFLIGENDYLNQVKDKVSAKLKMIVDIRVPEVGYDDFIFSS